MNGARLYCSQTRLIYSVQLVGSPSQVAVCSLLSVNVQAVRNYPTMLFNVEELLNELSHRHGSLLPSQETGSGSATSVGSHEAISN